MLTIELKEVIAAGPEAVWRLVVDPHRQHEYVGYSVAGVQPQNACGFGPEYRWKERGVLLGKRYDCDVRVLGWEPPQWFCFGTQNLFHISFELARVGEGTELSYRVELPQSPEQHREAINEVCRVTVRNLKSLLESQAHGSGI